MTRSLLGFTACFVVLLVLAAPSTAQIYRWTDASGREQFSAHLSDVPESQREAAAAAATESGAKLSSFESSSAAPRPAPQPVGRVRVEEAARAAENAEPVYGGRSELSWRQSVQSLVDKVAVAEGRLERCEARDQRRRMDSGLTGLDECEAERNGVEHAEEALASFEDVARSKGVPPGWLR